MALKHCIIHFAERSNQGAHISSSLRDKENSLTGPAASLFEQMRSSFRRSSQKRYGHFDPEMSENPLPAWLKDQSAGKSSFAKFSQRVMEHFISKLETTEDPFTCHLMMAVESRLEQDYFYLFWINHSEAQQIDNQQEVELTRYIDSGRLHYALCLHLDDWLEYESQKYLSILTARGDKLVSEAFSFFTAFKEGLDLEKDTREFLDIVDNYSHSLSTEKELPEEKVREFRNKVVDYCVDRDSIGEPIRIEELSQQLDEKQPKAFSRFVAQHQEDPRDEVYTHRPSLKRYIRFYGRDNDMSISFSADLIGHDIEYDASSGTLTIKKIPKSLRLQLQRHNQS